MLQEEYNMFYSENKMKRILNFTYIYILPLFIILTVFPYFEYVFYALISLYFLFAVGLPLYATFESSKVNSIWKKVNFPNDNRQSIDTFISELEVVMTTVKTIPAKRQCNWNLTFMYLYKLDINAAREQLDNFYNLKTKFSYGRFNYYSAAIIYDFLTYVYLEQYLDNHQGQLQFDNLTAKEINKISNNYKLSSTFRVAYTIKQHLNNEDIDIEDINFILENPSPFIRNLSIKLKLKDTYIKESVK